MLFLVVVVVVVGGLLERAEMVLLMLLLFVFGRNYLSGATVIGRMCARTAAAAAARRTGDDVIRTVCVAFLLALPKTPTTNAFAASKLINILPKNKTKKKQEGERKKL